MRKVLNSEFCRVYSSLLLVIQQRIDIVSESQSYSRSWLQSYYLWLVWLLCEADWSSLLFDDLLIFFKKNSSPSDCKDWGGWCCELRQQGLLDNSISDCPEMMRGLQGGGGGEAMDVTQQVTLSSTITSSITPLPRFVNWCDKSMEVISAGHPLISANHGVAQQKVWRKMLLIQKGLQEARLGGRLIDGMFQQSRTKQSQAEWHLTRAESKHPKQPEQSWAKKYGIISLWDIILAEAAEIAWSLISSQRSKEKSQSNCCSKQSRTWSLEIDCLQKVSLGLVFFKAGILGFVVGNLQAA